MTTLPDQVVCFRGSDEKPIWKVVLGGKFVEAEWPDKGSALAGLATEQRRLKERMKEIARGNIEQNLSDAVAEDGIDSLYDSAYVLGFDALHDAGYPDELSREVAAEVAQLMAQP